MSDEGARIKARRTRLGMDKKALAIESGVSRETLASVESGKGFRTSTLGKIQRALDALEAERAALPAGVRPIGDPAEGWWRSRWMASTA